MANFFKEHTRNKHEPWAMNLKQSMLIPEGCIPWVGMLDWLVQWQFLWQNPNRIISEHSSWQIQSSPCTLWNMDVHYPMNSRFITQSKQIEIWLDMDILPSSVNSMKANWRTEFGSPHMRQSTTFKQCIQILHTVATKTNGECNGITIVPQIRTCPQFINSAARFSSVTWTTEEKLAPKLHIIAS